MVLPLRLLFQALVLVLPQLLMYLVLQQLVLRPLRRLQLLPLLHILQQQLRLHLMLQLLHRILHPPRRLLRLLGLYPAAQLHPLLAQ